MGTTSEKTGFVLATRMLAVEGIKRVFDELVEFLDSYGIVPKPGSELEHWLLFPDTWQRLASGSVPEAEEEYSLEELRRSIRGVLGTLELASHVLAASRSGLSMAPMLGHLRHLTEARSPAQSVRSLSDEDANKTFELLLALLAARAGATDVELENPTPARSRAPNPDVLATWEDRRVGIACKVLDSPDPRAFVRNLERGLRQLQASQAASGCVCLNLKNLVPEDLLLPIETDTVGNRGWVAHPTLDAARVRLRAWYDDYLKSVSGTLTPEFWDRFEDERLEPEVELYVFDVCLVASGSRTGLHTLKFFAALPVGGRECRPEHSRFMSALNAAQSHG